MKTTNYNPALSFFALPLVVSPAQLLVSCHGFEHIRDQYDTVEELRKVRLFHVDPTIGWFVAEMWSGQFWTLANNADRNFPTLEEAIAWLSAEGGAGEFAHAMARL